ncbi:cupin domain-containing protein [Dyella japonica]|nr:cupin domain-containing protein [Dyella japonica]
MVNRLGSGIAGAALACACLCGGAAYAQDMVKVAPNNTKVLLENDQVRVIEVTVKPGETIPMHSHPANVVYFVTGGKTKTTTADGKVTDTDHKAGEALWSEPITHSNKNMGTLTTKALVIELKTAK